MTPSTLRSELRVFLLGSSTIPSVDASARALDCLPLQTRSCDPFVEREKKKKGGTCVSAFLSSGVARTIALMSSGRCVPCLAIAAVHSNNHMARISTFQRTALLNKRPCSGLSCSCRRSAVARTNRHLFSICACVRLSLLLPPPLPLVNPTSYAVKPVLRLSTSGSVAPPRELAAKLRPQYRRCGAHLDGSRLVDAASQHRNTS